jgi:hypothetical protein
LGDQQVGPVGLKSAAFCRNCVSETPPDPVSFDRVANPPVDGEPNLGAVGIAQRNRLNPKAFTSATRCTAQQCEDAPLSHRLH